MISLEIIVFATYYDGMTKLIMVILVTGGSGLIGSGLIAHLELLGHTVIRLVRSSNKLNDKAVLWSTSTGYFPWDNSIQIDAMVHLAGETILGLWTQAKKRRIYDSRVTTTQQLSKFLASLKYPPRTLIAASATGYYGDRSEEVLIEESLPGKGYLPSVCQEWEEATESAQRAGIRVINLRIGVVLSSRGGILAHIKPPFLMGLGGKIGTGRQYMSWITREDLVSIIQYILETEEIIGPINAVSPQPVTNKYFTQSLGTALNRPTLFSVPSVVIRSLLGEMGKDLMLASTRVQPQILEENGFSFRYPDLTEALDHLLDPSKPHSNIKA